MIPQYQTFRDEVGKGPNVNKVCGALQDYWLCRNRNANDQDIIVAYTDIINACKVWIKLKANKSEYKKSFGRTTNYYNQKFLGRKVKISALGQSAAEDLLNFLAQNGYLQQGQRGALSFDVRKFKEKGKRNHGRLQTKSLSTGYTQERETWLRSGKTVAVSGTQIHGLVTSAVQLQDTSLYNTNLQPIRNLSKTQSRSWQNILNDNSSGKDWEILSQINDFPDVRVAFLRKQERLRYMAYVNGNGCLEREDGHALDTGQDIQGIHMVLWAMDSYGNLFVYDVDTMGQDVGIGQVNHSSVNAGREVICAGCIGVDNGCVTVLNNVSGHYKPTLPNLANALRLLVEEGLDITRLVIQAIDHGTPAPPYQAWWLTFDAAQFVQSNGTCQPTDRQLGPVA